jgi:hypothetical protein
MSVVLRKKDRGEGTICLRDDPEPASIACSINGEEARAVLKRTLISPSVMRVDLAPVALRVPAKGIGDFFAAKPFQGSWGGMDFPQREAPTLFSFGRVHGLSVLSLWVTVRNDARK